MGIVFGGRLGKGEGGGLLRVPRFAFTPIPMPDAVIKKRKIQVRGVSGTLHCTGQATAACDELMKFIGQK